MDPQKREAMLNAIFAEIEIETEGFVPVRWRPRGATNWRNCVYRPEDEEHNPKGFLNKDQWEVLATCIGQISTNVNTLHRVLKEAH